MRHFSARIFLTVLAAPLLLPCPAVSAADLNATLAKLNAAAAKFRSTTADFEFDSIQTEPVPDRDVQKGVVYYRRSGSGFQMGVHIGDVNGQKIQKTIVCCEGGSVKLYEQKLNQVTTLSKLSQYESWFMLGFGASGADLASKWNIRDLGEETLSGVKTEKLEMTPKDPAVRRTVPKVTLWMDLDRGVSLKQVFDEGAGQSRVCTYTNFRMNEKLPADAFTIKTNKQTVFVSR